MKDVRDLTDFDDAPCTTYQVNEPFLDLIASLVAGIDGVEGPHPLFPHRKY
jgi:hypothetical protein